MSKSADKYQPSKFAEALAKALAPSGGAKLIEFRFAL